jgi:hypothetical protein
MHNKDTAIKIWRKQIILEDIDFSNKKANIFVNMSLCIIQGLLDIFFACAAIKVFLLVRFNDKTMLFMIVSLGIAGLCKFFYIYNLLFLVNTVFFALNSVSYED